MRSRRGGDDGSLTLAVLPAESDAFPRAARALTDSLKHAEVEGVDKKQVSKVSLEVVQLSIECVEQSPKCYKQVAKSLAADLLLFAQIAKERRNVQVTVTLYEVDSRRPRKASKVFASEQEATAGIQELVAEATR